MRSIKTLHEVVEFIKENIDKNILDEMPIFNTRDVVQHEAKLIYDKGNVQIYIYGDEYLEVIGISDKED